MDIQSYVDFQKVLKQVWSAYMDYTTYIYADRNDKLQIVNPIHNLDSYSEEENEDEDDSQSYDKLNQLCSELCHNEPLLSTVELDTKNLIQGFTLKTKMVPSPFGDLLTGNTGVDTSVRCAFEIPGSDITLTDNGERALVCVQKAAEKILNRSVRVRVNKLNKYTKGCFFANHVDTPHQGLLATGIIAMPYSHEGGLLVVKGNDKEEVWRSCDQECDAVIMFGNHTHQVTRVTSGNRVTLTLYIEEDAANKATSPPTFVSPVVQQIAASLPPRTAFLTTNQYSKWEADKCELRGIDLELQTALKATAIPVLILHNETHADCAADDCLSECVVPFNYDIMRTWITHTPRPMPSLELKDWKVFAPNTHYFTVYQRHIEGIEFTGNESQPEQEEGMYYSVLLIPQH